MTKFRVASRCVPALFLALAVATACGSSSSSGAAPVPEDQFPTAVASALCDHIQSCCEKAGVPYDAAACKQIVENSAAAQAQNGMRYDANAGGACVAAVSSAASACSIPTHGACDKVYVGGTAAGVACTNTSQCAQPSTGSGRAVCDLDTSVCVVLPRGKSGDSCAGDCYTGSSGQVCSVDTAGQGSVCYESDGLFCNQSGLCQPLLHAGDSCDYIGCSKGTYCSQSTSICTADIAVGQPCPDGTGCVSGAYCNNSNVCANLQPDGAPCNYPSECAKSWCTNGVCSNNAPIGNGPYCGGAIP